MNSVAKALQRPLLVLALALGIGASTAASASADVIWDIQATHGPTVMQPGEKAEFVFFVHNLGDEAADEVTMQIELPPGATTRMKPKVEYYVPEGPESSWFASGEGSTWECGTPAAGQSSLTCTAPNILPVRAGAPHLGRLAVWVDIPPSATGTLEATATVTGGGAQAVHVERAQVGPAPDRFGIDPASFKADAFDADGQPARQAGSRPFRAHSTFSFLQRNVASRFGSVLDHSKPFGNPRDVEVRLPRGFVGNPQVVDTCTPFGLEVNGGAYCPAESQVGNAEVMIGSAFYAEGASDALFPSDIQPVYNMPTPKGVLARFAFALAGRPTYIDAVLDPTDYSVIAQVKNIPSTVPVYFQQLNLWGVPGDPVHDSERYSPETRWGSPFNLPVKPFLSLPTECNVADTTDLVTLTSYANRETNVAEGLKSEPATLHGCDQLDFDPTVEVKPSTNVADAPAGLEFDLHIPQNEDPEGRATAHLKDAVVTLPAGMTVNPPSADGLGACSLEQIGLGTNDPVACPESSKLGTVEASSPPVDHPLPGSVYLAEQNRNPFNSLIAMYLVIEDPETGLLVKLPGRADLDPTTGQITATFKNNPQLPVEDLALKFFEGPRAALKTPTTCGNHTTQATFTPWSSPEGADATEQSTFSLTQGPAGGACLPAGAQAPNAPAFSAGTADPTAKAYTPFSLKLTRADGTQQLQGIDTLLPEGLTGKLAGIPYCSEASLAAAQAKQGKAEQAVPSCPLASKVGIVNVGAGAGSTPLYVQGQAYLAGPYKGAPLSLAIVTPAVAGPFDLGTVVVRTALHVDPATAQIHAVSDPFPRILEGVPLNIRSIALRMDRPDFTLNPTSCDPMAITGSALSVFNQLTPLSERFQVGECSKLKFKPKLSLRLKGKTKRTGHPALTAVLTQPQGGQANIDRVSVVLPRAQFIDQGRIGEVCTRDQFAARACPAKSILGTATAYTPLLDRPLTGTVYLRANGGARELPDMVAALRGQINVDLVGYVDAVVTPGTEISRIRNTFAIVPDAPVSKFVLRLNAGKKALLENSRNLCKSTQEATVRMLGQNGKAYDFSPSVENDCAKKPKNGKGGKGKRG